MRNENIKVCFDVDGTLIQLTGANEDTPRYEVIELFLAYHRLGCQMYIHSGGGIDYATRWKEKLGLNARVVEKGSVFADIVFDDEEVKLGKVNIRV